MPELLGDFTEVFGEVGLMLDASIFQNFIDGGRPSTWQEKADGSPSFLMKTGALVNSRVMESGSDFARVYFDTELIPYAAIHNFGGTIVFKTKGYSIEMPKRQYLLFQEEDKSAILKKIANAMFVTSQPKKRRTQ